MCLSLDFTVEILEDVFKNCKKTCNLCPRKKGQNINFLSIFSTTTAIPSLSFPNFTNAEEYIEKNDQNFFIEKDQQKLKKKYLLNYGEKIIINKGTQFYKHQYQSKNCSFNSNSHPPFGTYQDSCRHCIVSNSCNLFLFLFNCCFYSIYSAVHVRAAP